MKKILKILLLLLLLSISGCSKNNEVSKNENPINNTLIGKWKYAEFLGIDVGNPNGAPYLIANGYTITFNVDGTFNSNEFIDYTTGTYSVSNENIIRLNYISTIKPTYERTKKIDNLTTAQLKLNPTDRNCIEGCGERFEKIP